MFFFFPPALTPWAHSKTPPSAPRIQTGQKSCPRNIWMGFLTLKIQFLKICLTVPDQAKPSWPPQPPEWLLLVSHPCLGWNPCPFPAFPQIPKLPHIQRCQLFAGSALGRSCQCLSAASGRTNKSPSPKFLHIPRPLERDEWNLSVAFPL